MKYLAFDGINCDYEEFDTIEEAREWIEEGILHPNEGYHPDGESFKIYQLVENLKYNVIAERKNFTAEQWEEMYDSNYDEIWEHKFVKADEKVK
jgi:hypothetical protein